MDRKKKVRDRKLCENIERFSVNGESMKALLELAINEIRENRGEINKLKDLHLESAKAIAVNQEAIISLKNHCDAGFVHSDKSNKRNSKVWGGVLGTAAATCLLLVFEIVRVYFLR